MKSGAGSPFDEDDFDEGDEPEEPESTSADEVKMTTQDTGTVETTTTDLPYKYRRDGVQDGRNHGNIFLRDEAEKHIDDLVHELNNAFENETVYKIDVLEAAILAAGDAERTVEGELRKMGYGMK